MAHAFRIEPTPTPAPGAVRPRLRAVPEPTTPCRPRPSRAQRRPARRRADRSVVGGIVVHHGARYTLRRTVAALVVVAALAVAWVAVAAVGSALGTPAPAGADQAAVTAVPGDTVSVVVRPGGTVWALAARVVGPGADPRPVVDALVDHLGSPVLMAGERIDLPADLVG